MTFTKNILLINPFVYDFTAFDYWAKPKGLLEVGKIFTELGFTVELIDCLCKEDKNMAAFARQRSGIQQALVKQYGTGRCCRQEIEKPPNMNTIARRMYRFGIHPDLLRERLKNLKTKPTLIGVSGIMTYWCRGVKETIAIVKDIFPYTPVVLGGIYPSLIPEHAREYSGADIIFSGKVTKERLISLLQQTGLCTTISGRTDHADTCFFYPYPDPSYGVINLSEGCPKNCTYCASKILRPHYTGHNVEMALQEIKFFADQGIQDIAFYDDALLFQKEKRLLPFLEQVVDEFPLLRFHTPNGMHLDLLDNKTADLMYRANFKTLRFGFETAQPELSIRTGLKIRLHNCKNKIEILKEAGFTREHIGIYVMIGLPGQTVESVEESLEFVRSCRVNANITEFSPIPGTIEFVNAQQNAPVDFTADPELQNNSLLPLRDRTFSFDVVNRLKNICYRAPRKSAISDHQMPSVNRYFMLNQGKN